MSGLAPSSRVGDVRAMTRVVRTLPANDADPTTEQRKLVADFCRLVGARFSRSSVAAIPGLSSRHVQTLERLLAGDSEKQAAARLGVTRNTVHVYVTALYRHFNVSSRGELLARFVRT